MIRLYRAVCTWIEASARQMDAPDEFYPEGAGEAKSEHAHSYTSEPELHSGYGRQSLDDDDGGTYRRRRAGF